MPQCCSSWAWWTGCPIWRIPGTMPWTCARRGALAGANPFVAQGTLMEREVLVYVDLRGAPHLVGRLWSRLRKEKESATFEYDKSWLAHPEHFSLEPALKLGPGPFYAPHEKPLF